MFRAILVCLALVYQLLAWLIGFRVLPALPFLLTIAFVSVASWCYYWAVIKFRLDSRIIGRWVVGSLIADAMVISALVWMTGGVHSNLSLSYLVIIPLGAIFVSKISIYILTVLCFVMLYTTVTLIPPWKASTSPRRCYPKRRPISWPANS